MPAPLDPEVRASIEEAIRAGQTRNQIARAHGVSGSTVTKIARDLEPQGVPAFDRSATKSATEARVVDLASRRAQLAELLMDDAFAMRLRFHEERVVGTQTVDGEKVPVRAKPGGRDTQGFAVALGILVDKVKVLTEADSGAGEAASLLSTLVGDIRGRRTTVVPDAAE